MLARYRALLFTTFDPTTSFSRMLWLATAIGAGSGAVGMNLSYHLDVHSGRTIVLTAAALFALVFRGVGDARGRPSQARVSFAATAAWP